MTTCDKCKKKISGTDLVLRYSFSCSPDEVDKSGYVRVELCDSCNQKLNFAIGDAVKKFVS